MFAGDENEGVIFFLLRLTRVGFSMKFEDDWIPCINEDGSILRMEFK